jgi:hypothetical protein
MNEVAQWLAITCLAVAIIWLTICMYEDRAE